MDKKALDALRNGLEDSYWYGDDDEKVFNELVRKAEAFDESIEAIRVNLKSVRSDYGGFTLNALKKQRVVTTENVLEAMEILMAGLLEYHESGGYDAKK